MPRSLCPFQSVWWMPAESTVHEAISEPPTRRAIPTPGSGLFVSWLSTRCVMGASPGKAEMEISNLLQLTSFWKGKVERPFRYVQPRALQPLLHASVYPVDAAFVLERPEVSPRACRGLGRNSDDAMRPLPSSSAPSTGRPARTSRLCSGWWKISSTPPSASTRTLRAPVGCGAQCSCRLRRWALSAIAHWRIDEESLDGRGQRRRWPHRRGLRGGLKPDVRLRCNDGDAGIRLVHVSK